VRRAFFCCSLVPHRRDASTRRGAHPGKSRRCGWPISRTVLGLAAIRSTSGDRWAVLLRLYAGVLSTIPSNRICVTPKAVLRFHSPRWVDRQGRQYPATAETRLVAATYPARVRTWIERHGGLTSKPILLRGRELAAMFPRCR
jgi:hypothetical protein